MSDAQQPPEEQKTPDKPASEKLWNATVRTWNTATFRADQYRRIVQKKIDLTSVHKKISTGHTDLGKLIDDLHQAGTAEILSRPEVEEVLHRLDSLRSAAALLEEEIVVIKAEEPSLEDSDEPPNHQQG